MKKREGVHTAGKQNLQEKVKGRKKKAVHRSNIASVDGT